MTLLFKVFFWKKTECRSYVSRETWSLYDMKSWLTRCGYEISCLLKTPNIPPLDLLTVKMSKFPTPAPPHTHKKRRKFCILKFLWLRSSLRKANNFQRSFLLCPSSSHSFVCNSLIFIHTTLILLLCSCCRLIHSFILLIPHAGTSCHSLLLNCFTKWTLSWGAFSKQKCMVN